MPADRALRFALDHNFPPNIIRSLDVFVPEVELTAVNKIAPGMADLDDGPLIDALVLRGWDALVTTDGDFLWDPEVTARVLSLSFKVIVVKGLGHDPVRATGALLWYLPGVVKQLSPGRPQIFEVNPRMPSPRRPCNQLKRIAEHRSVSATDLYREFRVRREDLVDPLG